MELLSLQSPVTAIFGRLECDWLRVSIANRRCWINHLFIVTEHYMSPNYHAFVCALLEVHSNIGTNYCKSR